MKKEGIIAIILGVVFGIIMAVVMISKTKEKQLEKLKPLSNIKPSLTISPKEIQTQSLEILNPQDNTIINAKAITIKGKTNKDSLIVIQSPIKDMAFKNKAENFSMDFPLAMGENVIQIVVYPKDNQIRSQERVLRVYYLDEQ